MLFTGETASSEIQKKQEKHPLRSRIVELMALLHWDFLKCLDVLENIMTLIPSKKTRDSQMTAANTFQLLLLLQRESKMVARNATTALRKRGSTTAECSCDHSGDNKESSSTNLFSKQRQAGAGGSDVRGNTLKVFIPLLLVVLLIKVAITTHSKPSTANLRSPVQQLQQQQKRNRFPKYGTDEFNKQCNWTLPSFPEENPSCMILVRPPIHSNEGIADWASQITRAYMTARQVHCKVVFDYGLDVDIHKVLIPFSNTPIHNWTVPSDIECHERCQNSVSFKFGDWNGHNAGIKKVPYYRHMFTFTHDWIYRGDYDYMSQVLPGFQMETGMACALGTLLQLSPQASQFEPSLFTTLLPALHDTSALVIALYMRTNRADVMAVNEKRNETIQQEVRGKYNSSVDSFADIAHCLEHKYLTGQMEQGVDIQRVYWIVLSDSPEAKLTMIENHSGINANEAVSVEERKWKDRIVERKVLATGARGIHVRAERKPSTDEFAEAFLDWYLIGESDVVVTDMSSSFGPTGALRTNRPIYRIGKCEQLPLVHELSEKKEKKKKLPPHPVGGGGNVKNEVADDKKKEVVPARRVTADYSVMRGPNGERVTVPKPK